MNFSRSLKLPVNLFQKPVEVFAGLMPLNRCLFSSRLYLRRLKRSDSVELLKLYRKNRKYLSRWLQPQPETISIQDMVNLIKEDHIFARKGERLDLGIFSFTNDALIGRVALHSVDYGIQRSSGLSYWLDEDFAGQGLMTEAIATISSFAFEEAFLHRVWLKINHKNNPSLAIAEKLGFRKEGALVQNLYINGEWQNSSLFAMLEHEYDQIADGWIAKGWLGSMI